MADSNALKAWDARKVVVRGGHSQYRMQQLPAKTDREREKERKSDKAANEKWEKSRLKVRSSARRIARTNCMANSRAHLPLARRTAARVAREQHFSCVICPSDTDSQTIKQSPQSPGA